MANQRWCHLVAGVDRHGEAPAGLHQPGNGLPHDHFAAQPTVTADDGDTLVYAYAGTRTAGRGQRMYTKRSTDGGMLCMTEAVAADDVWWSSR